MTKVSSSPFEIAIIQPPTPDPSPSWLPAVGQRVNRTTSMVDVAPTAPAIHGVAGIGAALWYSGGAYAQYLGPYGSVVKTTTGHMAYAGNEVYRLDPENGCSLLTQPHTNLFALNAVPAAQFSHSDIWFSPQPGGASNGEHWTDATGTATLPLQPGAFQAYSGVDVLPPGVGGAGPNGAFLTPMRPAMTPDSGYGLRSHLLQLHDPKWERYSVNQIPFNPNATIGMAACVAVGQNKVYMAHGNIGSISQLDLATKMWSLLNVSDPNFQISAGQLFYSNSKDRIGFVRSETIIQIIVITPSGIVTTPTMVGTLPIATSLAGSAVWVEQLGCMYYYNHDNAINTLYKATPDSTWTTWTWTSEAMGGDAPVNDNSTSQYTRLFWSDAARCLVWLGRVDAPLQVWTPQR